jgi:lipid-A-disaccharide synthase
MKKIFVLTGEPSGDKLASKIIACLKVLRPDIEYLSVGGEHLKTLGIKSIYDLKEVTYLGFTRVLLNIFKLRKKINETVDEIIKFKPDILFSVDSPDLTLRIAKKIKKIDPIIKTIHYVAPQVWLWREGRVKKIKKFIDHILLLFNFEKKYFEKENVKATFVGHPLLEKQVKNKIDLTQLLKKNKKIISIFPGSRISEINILLPILIKFIILAQSKNNNFLYIFHTSKILKSYLNNLLSKSKLNDCEIISDEDIKRNILSKSIFAIAKSGTVSLEICNENIPSLVIYKMNFINFIIIKLLIKVKYANIFNIISNSEIIPELLQSKCNPQAIYNVFNSYMQNPELSELQISKCNKILNDMKTNSLSAEKVAEILISEF